MSTPAEYRELALDCMREAEGADSVTMRVTMAGLAGIWMRLALDMEQRMEDDGPHQRTDAP
jgi:hypothetical protein